VKRRKKNKLEGESLRKLLQKACGGLVYISESDAEIEPILVEKDRSLSVEDLIEKTASSRAIETKPAAEFFERLTRDREWHGEAERRNVGRFRDLERIIFDNIADLRMFRVGRIRVDIFVLGHDTEGNIAGIRTNAVET
jgi:hypothetical protein